MSVKYIFGTQPYQLDMDLGGRERAAAEAAENVENEGTAQRTGGRGDTGAPGRHRVDFPARGGRHYEARYRRTRPAAPRLAGRRPAAVRSGLAGPSGSA